MSASRRSEAGTRWRGGVPVVALAIARTPKPSRGQYPAARPRPPWSSTAEPPRGGRRRRAPRPPPIGQAAGPGRTPGGGVAAVAREHGREHGDPEYTA